MDISIAIWEPHVPMYVPASDLHMIWIYPHPVWFMLKHLYRGKGESKGSVVLILIIFDAGGYNPIMLVAIRRSTKLNYI